MKITWQPAIFLVVNLFFIGWVAAIMVSLVRVLNGEDPLILLGILAADVAFLGVGIFLIVLNKYYPISPANRALPFIAFIGLTAIAILNVSSATLWLGLILSATLIIFSIVTSILTVTGRWTGSRKK